MPRSTIKDIARECGVSLSTVSLVLNGSPRISAGTRTRVMEAVARHGYQPNIHARGLASRSSRAVSVVVPHLSHVFSDIYFGELVSGIYDGATETGYKMLLDIANERYVRSEEYLNILKSRRADGLLSIASSIRDRYLLSFEGSPFPFLLVNHYFPGSSLNHIVVDYRDSARQAADHLVGLGHRAIGVIAGTNTHTGLDFRDTFIALCRKRGLKEEDLPWEDGGELWNLEGGFAAAERLLRRHPELTVILAANDRMAICAMRHVNEQGWRVPEDISVMGVDDIPQAEFTVPALTTVRHQLYAIGRRSCEVLLGLFRGEIASCREVLPVRLVVRQSTARPRTTARLPSRARRAAV